MELQWSFELIKDGEHTPEQVLIRDSRSGYPMALVHIDTFWTGKTRNELYEAIEKGKKVDAVFRLVEMEHSTDA